jgi:hypothetical protein
LSPRVDKEKGSSVYYISSQLATADDDKRLDRARFSAKTIEDHTVQVRNRMLQAPQRPSRSSSSVQREGHWIAELALARTQATPPPPTHTHTHTHTPRHTHTILGCDHGLLGKPPGTSSKKQASGFHLRVERYHYTPEWCSCTCPETYVLV